MKSYGKFLDFEIRDTSRVSFKKGKLKSKTIDAKESGVYDLIKWEEYDSDKRYCYSIAHLIFDKENGFRLESIGLRYLTHSTEKLNEWLLKWCELKEFELYKGETCEW